MTKILRALILPLALSLASCTYAQNALRPAPRMQTAEIQDQEAVKQLGEGFQRKVRTVPGLGEIILIKFPDDKHWSPGDEGSFQRFKEAANKAFILQFGTEAFKDGKPSLEGDANGIYIALKDGRTYAVNPLFETDEHTGPVIGVVLVKLTQN